ncbi:VOC family protein [Caldifermentibacillus hisashii]|uniref:VOC family protein n=1 Tax=Caldifermentibacillus hisashii TaxID=996558 RepID=UPI003100F49A
MKGIDHIGIAVHSLEKALPLYTGTFQLSHIKTEVVESQKVKVAFIDVNNSKIELLEPTSDDSTIKKFLDKKGEGIHHIAFKTDDIYAAHMYIVRLAAIAIFRQRQRKKLFIW